MAATYSHGNFGVELCDALGIPSQRAVNVIINCKAGELVTVTVDFFIDEQSCDNVLTLMKKYHIEEREE